MIAQEKTIGQKKEIKEITAIKIKDQSEGIKQQQNNNLMRKIKPTEERAMSTIGGQND